MYQPSGYIHNMNNASAVLDRFLEPVRQSLTLEQAKQLADFRADDATQATLDDLADKCKEGTLSEKERREYEAYVDAGDMIAVLQAEAREILANAEA
jgi:ribosomal protein L13